MKQKIDPLLNGLTTPTKRWAQEVLEQYDLDPAQRQLLRSAAEAWDLSRKAWKQVQAEGITVTDRFGQPKANPSTAVYNRACNNFMRTVRELNLEHRDELRLGSRPGPRPLGGPRESRPPRLVGRTPRGSR